MKKIVIIVVCLIINHTTFSQNNHCYIYDSLPPYKHSIMLQANPIAVPLNDINNFFDYRNWDNPKYMINLRYGYRVHKNIMLGADLTYYNSKCYNSLENIRTCVANYNTVNIGAFSRFIVSKYKVVKPFADIVILYNYSHAKFDTTYSVYSYSAPIDNYHSFNCSITPGISFMIWQNHINFDLGAKFSPFKKNYNGSYFMFTWKIGYSFNAK